MKTNQFEKLPGSSGCILCDSSGVNPRSFALNLFWNASEKSLHIPCLPEDSWCGYTNVVHGGVIASLLDEAMAWAVKQTSGEWAFTADFHVRYKAPMYSGQLYEAIGNVVSLGRKITTSAFILHRDSGKKISEAEAIFLPHK